MSILFYQKPQYVEKEADISQSSCQRYVERAAGSRATIPSELSFENVVEGRSLPPCTLQDFLDYLVYVSHDAENLQFYLWLRDYKKRFAALPPDLRALSQPWQEAGLPRLSKSFTRPSTRSTMPSSPPTPATFSSLSTLSPSAMKPLPRTPVVPVATFPPSPALELNRWGTAESDPLVVKDLSRISSDTSVRAPSPQPPFTPQPSPDVLAAQPFRQEINRIAAHYIASGGPRELNLSGRDRKMAMQALEHTTHPSALAAVGRMCEQALRHHSHRNFVRWSICNGNKPRVFVLRSIAVSVLVVVAALCIFLILSGFSRWYRLALAPGLYFGCVNLIAAHQGLCVLLHRRHTRERRPWEIGAEDAKPAVIAVGQSAAVGTNESEVTPWQVQLPADGGEDGERGKPARVWKERLAAFGPRNDYSSEAWVRRWERRNPWQKIRIQKVRIADNGGLRMIQDRIVWQAEAWGLLVTVVVMAIVTALPVFDLYK